MSKPIRWAVIPNWNGTMAVINPDGDHELGTWMICERVRSPEHARLIATAPEMRDQLKNILTHLENAMMSDLSVKPQMVAVAFPEIRALLAKIEETP